MPKRKRRLSPTNDATDLTDAQRSTIAPLVTVTSPKGGRPTEIDLRAIINALLYKNRTGCQWLLLPVDVLPMSSVRSYFDIWNGDRTFVKIYDTPCQLAQQALDRNPEPSIIVLDSPSTKTTEAGGERGFDGKKVNGRKHQFWVDTNGFLLRVLVHSTDISDAEGVAWLLTAHYRSFPRMQATRVDEGINNGEMRGWKRTRQCA